MERIEGFRVRNFKVLKEVTLGRLGLSSRLWRRQDGQPLTAMTAVIGKNGVGKSALFDAFGFLADALKSGVEEACDARGRGGFDKLRTQGERDRMEVCDLDDRCLKSFRQELFAVLNACSPKPETRFCIAIEEGEAWLLGDVPAIETAYPNAKLDILKRYKNDSICGTWEVLADAVFTGGSGALKSGGWQAVGREKSEWSERIAPLMDVENNASPSFQYFRRNLRELAR